MRALGPVTGIIAAAATGGALLGFGIRAGTPSRPFNGIATLVLGDRARGVWGYVSTVTVTGILLHVAITIAWSMLFVALASRRKGWQVAMIAVGVSAAAWVVAGQVVLRQVGAGMSSVLGAGQLVVLHVVLAVALVLGMRFARSDVPNGLTNHD